jgi:hypothetical protein
MPPGTDAAIAAAAAHGYVTLADLDDLLRKSQRVILDGRNYGHRIEWVVDVITDLADGHEISERLETSVRGAIQEAQAAGD